MPALRVSSPAQELGTPRIERGKHMEPTNTADDTTAAPAKRSALVRFAPIIVVVLLVVLAVVVLSRPAPGRKTTTETSTAVIVSTASPAESVQYPITLVEGGDAAHEADHVFEPLMGVDGVASAKLDWSSGVALTVEFDPEIISAQEVASIVMSSGYVSTPPAQ